MKERMRNWRKAELSEEAAEIPPIGQTTVLHCRPRNPKEAWTCDIGSLDCEEEDGLVWGSAFGLYSAFDGVKFGDILKDYEVCFAEVPPLAERRFPLSPGIPRDGMESRSGVFPKAGK